MAQAPYPDDPQDHQPRQLERSTEFDSLAVELRWASRCLSVMATATIGLLLFWLRPVLAPFVVAIFLTVGLKPILDLLQRRLFLNRLAAVAVAFAITVILLFTLGVAIASSIDQLANDDAYQRRAAAATARIATIAERFGLLPTAGLQGDEMEATSISRLQIAVRAGTRSAKEWLLSGMISLSGSLGVVLIYMLFLLLGASRSVAENNELWKLIEGKLREYIVLKTIISLFTGIAVWAVLAIFSVPLAVLMGLLTFLLNYIPNFGPLVTCILPLPIIWLSPDLGFGSMVVATVLACGVQFVGGNVVEPRIMGSSFNLHPIVVMLALMGWYAIWGFVGMLLAVPMTASLKVVLERIDRTESIAKLMAGDLSPLRLGRNAVE
ncbi:AI-2E family transporter [Stieleria sp. JC731]|uniref:AI-2E family transporter n=1 Tax=Pirellulaceae TaxID=2691357 RepID=UPI001E468F5A|nr:AI-2E family transporter [Stieleria sp. JC731]MCC9600713.1 AI-2E family transporter [Stieleria sp. JC731]